jgi:hypothetical protein
MSVGQEFSTNLGGKNPIIDKSQYGSMTSAARFHEHLADLPLQLGFKKNKHEPNLWMIDKLSHKYLATYGDDSNVD